MHNPVGTSRWWQRIAVGFGGAVALHHTPFGLLVTEHVRSRMFTIMWIVIALTALVQLQALITVLNDKKG